MAGSFLRKLGLSRREDSSSDSEEEVRNEFNAPADVTHTEPNNADASSVSVFSRRAVSEVTRSSRNTGITGYTHGTADTDNSLRSDTSKRQRLQVIDVESGRSQSPRRQLHNFAELLDALNRLTAKAEVLEQQTNVGSASRISATLARLIIDFTADIASASFAIDSEQLPDQLLSTILRIVLGFTDLFMIEQTHRGARAHLLRALYHFAKALHLTEDSNSDSFAPVVMDGGAMTVPQPQMFAIGSSPKPVPNEALLEKVLDKFASGSVPIVEQDGAYAAPVLCGLSPRFAVAALCLGIPDFQSHHIEAIASLRSELKCLHVFGRRDSIIPAAVFSQPNQSFAEVKAPYRIPTDQFSPPMSISLATSTSNYVSGTLGGYVYPQASNSETVDRNIYALTCGHVCFSEEDNDDANPTIEYPSPVLRKLFRKALLHQRDRFDSNSPQWNVLDKGIHKVDQQVATQLGEVVWGERTVIGSQMSDTAVIKCNPSVNCQNWLGDDVELSRYDPSLISDQLKVRCIVGKARGLEVFKYGSTSRYTSGALSNIRVAYWANGVLQTSEFAVRSGDSSSFANGGDSGAWICSSTPAGLGVVGMLHSYDGEFREFGLYTPMTAILHRLHEVTGVPWGVLGVPTPGDDLHEEGERSD